MKSSLTAFYTKKMYFKRDQNTFCSVPEFIVSVCFEEYWLVFIAPCMQKVSVCMRKVFAPVESSLAAKLDTVDLGLLWSEDQVEVQSFLWEQCAEAIVWLHLHELYRHKRIITNPSTGYS